MGENIFHPEEVLQSLYDSHDRHKYFSYVYIPEDYIIQLCEKCKTIFLSEPPVLTIDAPVTICGDTHGQFTDTLRIFDVAGKPVEKQFLFLGDYVDRGPQSIENIVLLLTVKYLYPKTFFMIRGNHETEEISTVYGLRDECVRRYSFDLYNVFLSTFDCMPFAAIVSKTIFCVHGGIPATGVKIEDIMKVERPTEVSETSPVIDLLWSDPGPEVDGFIPSPRGVSFIFGKEEAEKFMDENGIQLIIRSHEFCQEGALFPFGENGGFLTIFSASNYCRTMNSSAIVEIDEKLELHFSMFTPVHQGFCSQLPVEQL